MSGNLVEETISVYIENYDKVASQYLLLRKNILSLQEDSEPYKVQQLQYELEKTKQLYSIHVESLETNREVISNLPSAYLTQLGNQFNSIEQTKNRLNNEIDNLKNIQKPLLDELSKLLKGFNDASDTKTVKKLHQIVRNGELVPQASEYGIEYENLIFDKQELDKIFNSIQQRFSRKEDGEVNEEMRDDDMEIETTGAGIGIDVQKYLDEYLENSKTLKRFGDNRYIYDVASRGEKVSSTVASYDQMIGDVMDSIEDLIESGVDAKERWSSNALKLDIIREALRED